MQNTAAFKRMVDTLANPKPTGVKDRLQYNVGGMMADGGEVLDAMKDYFYYEKTNFPTFFIQMAEELGDTLHWLVATASVMGLTVEQLMRVNEAKLSVRYPDGFTQACAVNRDKKAELEAMKKALRVNPGQPSNVIEEVR